MCTARTQQNQRDRQGATEAAAQQQQQHQCCGVLHYMQLTVSDGRPTRSEYFYQHIAHYKGPNKGTAPGSSGRRHCTCRRSQLSTHNSSKTGRLSQQANLTTHLQKQQRCPCVMLFKLLATHNLNVRRSSLQQAQANRCSHLHTV